MGPDWAAGPVSSVPRQRPAREVFVGPRLRASVAPLLRARSAFVLALLCTLFGILSAAALAAGIGFAVQAVLHGIGSGP